MGKTPTSNYIWASNTRKPVFRGCKQQRRRPACASLQTDQGLCYSLFGKYHILTCCRWNFYFIASLCSWGDWFESSFLFVVNPEDRFCRVAAHFYKLGYPMTSPLMKVFKKIPELMILRLAFHRNSSLKYWIGQIVKALIYSHVYQKQLTMYAWIGKQQVWISKIKDFGQSLNFHPWVTVIQAVKFLITLPCIWPVYGSNTRFWYLMLIRKYTVQANSCVQLHSGTTSQNFSLILPSLTWVQQRSGKTQWQGFS